MPHVPRLQVLPVFRKAVDADRRGIVRLAHELGITSYPVLSKLIRHRFSGTDLNLDRLRRLAALIGYNGELTKAKSSPSN